MNNNDVTLTLIRKQINPGATVARIMGDHPFVLLTLTSVNDDRTEGEITLEAGGGAAIHPPQDLAAFMRAIADIVEDGTPIETE